MAISANPYASYIGDLKPGEAITHTSARLANLVERLGPDGLERTYGPGKWTAREILCHLADTEIAFAFRLRQTLAEPFHIIQPFDQEAWATNYKTIPAEAAMKTFTALRAWNLALIEKVGAPALSKPVRHPERGDMTFETIIQTMAGHDGNHLRQLESIASQVQ